MGVVGTTGVTPVTGGLSLGAAAFLYAGALASTAQCMVSVYRVANTKRGRTDINDKLDKSDAYYYSMLGADFIGLAGAGGALKELKATNAVLRRSKVGWTQAATKPLSSSVRRELTLGLGLEATQVGSHVINRIVRKHLLDSAGAVLGIVGSADSGVIKELIVWITDDRGGT